MAKWETSLNLNLSAEYIDPFYDQVRNKILAGVTSTLRKKRFDLNEPVEEVSAGARILDTDNSEKKQVSS